VIDLEKKVEELEQAIAELHLSVDFLAEVISEVKRSRGTEK
jgi:hypothetical protein